MTGCGQVDSSDGFDEAHQAIGSPNGLGTNGLGTNGMGTNGLGTNGLGTNGLGTNGLGTNGLFKTWFNRNITANDEVMKYLVGCALDSSQTTSFKDSNNVTHSWTGNFGLATAWFTSAPTKKQQETVSGCLLSLVNSNGNHITVSLRGPTLSNSAPELATMMLFDGAFFGNVFTSTPAMYACYGKASDINSYAFKYMGRNCAYDGSCNITQVGLCSSVCTRTASGTAYPFDNCTVGGVTWANPMNIYLPTIIEAESGSGITPSADNTASGGYKVGYGFMTSEVYALSGLPAGSYTIDGWYNSGFDTSGAISNVSVRSPAGSGGLTFTPYQTITKATTSLALPAGSFNLTVAGPTNQQQQGGSLDLFVIHP